MPLIGFACKCGLKVNKMVAPGDLSSLKPKMTCPRCQDETMIRQLGRTNSVTKIKVDSGLYGKAVELTMEVIDDKYNKKV